MSEINGQEEAAVLGAETPEADVLEQLTELTEVEAEGEAEADTGRRWPLRLPLDANPADVAEQERLVEVDEDDYR